MLILLFEDNSCQFSAKKNSTCMPPVNVALFAAVLWVRMRVVVNEGDCLAIFHSVHRVMKAEKILTGQRLDIVLVPVPRQLSADCGMAIRYSHKLHSEVQRALAESALPVSEVWLMRAGKYQTLA